MVPEYTDKMHAVAGAKHFLLLEDTTTGISNIVKHLNNGHPFCRGFGGTIKGWPLLRSFI